ncbi:Transmembrane amino acid transporter protein [Aphelenchoides avenae]|nr:Transmembrane amino acid transporter protein [Aphelenchus avenae]
MDVAAKTRSGHFERAGGLHWFTTALFIVADMAGGGVVAIPVALLKAGSFFGAIAIAAISISFCYTAHLLGENWVIMMSRWPQYREHCRKPYPEMAYRSMGPRARTFTSWTLYVMLYGVSIVYLVLSAKIISEFTASLGWGVSTDTCTMILILSAVLFPVTLLKSPQDFWWAVVTAMITTAISVVMILIGTSRDYNVCSREAHIPPFNLQNAIVSLGTFMFAFGGHGVFPTLQHDMRKPTQFTRSSVVAFAMVALMYIPISILGYATYGDSLKDSIIDSIQTQSIKSAANFFIAVHCILTLTIVINPLNQEVEHRLRVPHHFGWQRVMVRTVVMLSIVFSAETVPSFGAILNLIGGTGVALTSAIMPCLFNLYLRADSIEKPKNVEASGSSDGPTTFSRVLERTPKMRLWANLIVIGIAIMCGAVTTWSAIGDMANSQFSVPCWISTGSSLSVPDPSHCCGPFHNVSSFLPTCTPVHSV